MLHSITLQRQLLVVRQNLRLRVHLMRVYMSSVANSREVDPLLLSVYNLQSVTERKDSLLGAGVPCS